MSTETDAPRPITRPENHQKILEMLGPLPRGRILDAPCGQGALSAPLRDLGFAVECCDIDVDNFKVPDLRVAYVELNQGKIPHDDASFDYVVSANGLHRLWNPGNAVREYARVLKPGGTLICSIPNYAHLARRLRFLVYGGIARNVSRVHTRQVSDSAGNFRQTLLFSQVMDHFEACGLEVQSLESARRKSTGLWLYPLALFIRLVGRFASKRSQRAYCIDQSNSAAILLGSHHLFLRVKKVGRQEGSS